MSISQPGTHVNVPLHALWISTALAVTARADLTLHVAPFGEDTASGVQDDPLSTLVAARDRVREHQAGAGEQPAGAIRVILHEGEYRLSETVRFSADDSGTAFSSIVYSAAPGEDVRFSGGHRLDGRRWEPVTEPEVIARLPGPHVAQHVLAYDLRADGIDVTDTIHPRGFPNPIRPAPIELFFNGMPMTLARYPDEGFVHTGEVIQPGAPAEGETAPRLPVFTFDDDRLSRWAGVEDVWLFGYWKWDWADEAIRVAAIDPHTRRITLAAPHRYGVHAGKSFWVENLLEELDRPGEYYLDRGAGVLYFWPPEAMDLGDCVISTLAEPMIRLDDVRHVRLEGITFQFSRGDAVVIEDGAQITISDCTLRNLGNRAIVVTGGVGHLIRRCSIEQTGEGGIALTGGDRRTLTPCDHRVTDCRIRDFSRRTATYRPAVRLSGVGCRVDHCELHDAPHSAILFGGNDHVIEYNDIHHVLTRTGDGGAVYCGRDWTLRGTIIRRNHFHHLVGIRKWESAVYIDDQASGITIRENLFTNCHWGMLMGGGRDNVIEGNVFIDCGLALHFDARGLGWAARMRGILTERLEAVPYRQDPWVTRFPELLTLLDDEPMVPKGNDIRGNLLVRSGRIDEDMAGEVKSFGNVAGNQSYDHEPHEKDPNAAVLRSVIHGEVGPRQDAAGQEKQDAADK
ncbi:MAG: right-handed parallel beta-helix repeat-containing protein [Planctomycetota bacterium]